MAEATAGTFTQSPAATTFVTLYGRAQNYVMGPSDTEVATIAKEAINEGIKRINTRAWTWSRTTAAVTFVTGESGREYQLPTNWHSPRSFELIDSSSRIAGRLQYEDGKTFDRWFDNRAVQGDPSHYTVFNLFANGYLTINAAPSSGFVAAYPTGRLRYYQRLAFLSGDSDLFSGPTEAEPFLVWYARAVLASHWDPSKVAYAEGKAEMWWRDLIRDDVKTDIRDFTG